MAELYGVGSLEKFQQAFNDSMPSDKIIYHVGHSLGGPSALVAYYLYEQGLLELVQRRSDQKGVFEYIGVRTKKHRDGNAKPPKNYARPKQV